MNRAVFDILKALDEKYGVSESLTEINDRIDAFKNPVTVPEGYVLVPRELPPKVVKRLVGNDRAGTIALQESYRVILKEVSGE